MDAQATEMSLATGGSVHFREGRIDSQAFRAPLGGHFATVLALLILNRLLTGRLRRGGLQSRDMGISRELPLARLIDLWRRRIVVGPSICFRPDDRKQPRDQLVEPEMLGGRVGHGLMEELRFIIDV